MNQFAVGFKVGIYCKMFASLFLNISDVMGRQFYDPRHVKEYFDYGSVTLFPFRIPDRVSHAGWQFIKHRSDTKCPQLTIYV